MFGQARQASNALRAMFNWQCRKWLPGLDWNIIFGYKLLIFVYFQPKQYLEAQFVVSMFARPFAGGPWWTGLTGWNDETSVNIIMFIQLLDYAMYALERVINYWPRDQNQGSLYTESADLVETVKGSKRERAWY